MGYDAFGLPAENHAIKTGRHPRESTEAAIVEFRRQFRRWGISIDWTREFATCEPRLLPLDPVDLPRAVRARPRLPQGGRRQLGPGRGDRAGQRAGRRRPRRALRRARRAPPARPSGSSRITRYADRLLADLDTIHWPEHVKTMQRNWIGRSAGAEVVFRCDVDRRRLPRLHHPARHAVRRDLLRHGARAPRRPAPGRGHAAGGGRARLRQSRAGRRHPGARRRRQGEDRRRRSGAP